MWTSLKTKKGYIVTQKLLGKSPVNMSMVTSNSI